MKKPFLFFLLFILAGCVTTLKTQPGVPEISYSDYESKLDKKTKKLEVYDGFYNKLTVQATWLDSDFTLANLSQQARIAQWDEAKYKEEKAKIVSHHASSTEFFLSFYTPERKHDNLSSNKSMWKIFLEIDGRRFEGKATKVKGQLPEIQSLYAYHNRWSTAYILNFPISTGLSENKKAILTFTGPIGVAQLEYN